VESAAGGLLAGVYCGMLLSDGAIAPVPRTTAIGSLAFYISHARAIDYQPTNVSFGIIPELGKPVRKKKQRREALAARALRDLDSWIDANGATLGLTARTRRVAG
jgi:methylenetetrahydrofolate--tRNA-(uracil-5-)-methyltransferase